MILAESYVGTGMKLGPPLANDDVAGKNLLATVALDSKSLGFGIATVLGTVPYLRSSGLSLNLSGFLGFCGLLLRHSLLLHRTRN